MIICVWVPRFELVVAAGGRTALVDGPAALAPEPGREQMIGEVSGAAEAVGVRPGMRIGEALARCPTLALVPPDPLGVADAWERVLERMESIGAAVASERPGVACFAASGVRRLHGGSLDGVVSVTRAKMGGPTRVGAARTPFAALAAAHAARPRRAVIVAEPAARFLASRSIELLRGRKRTAHLPDALERLGVRTLGELAALPRAAVADRFGAAGLHAHELASGVEERLVPRRPGESLEELLELPEAGAGDQLGHALGLLIDRLLARPERRGRAVRSAVLAASLVEGGTWRERVVFREPLADPQRMRLVLTQRLALLPAPAEELRLSVERFGPPEGEQGALLGQAAAHRQARLREAVRQARAAAGPEAALRVLIIDPDSRVPERRAVLTPFEGLP